jgi:hypothetical protein
MNIYCRGGLLLEAARYRAGASRTARLSLISRRNARSQTAPTVVLLVIAVLFLSVPALPAQNENVLVPRSSWDCGMPGGIPSPESGVLIFEAETKLERIANIGKTPYGDRQIAVVQDGGLSGTKVSGSVMPGALDLELTLSNGTIEIEQFFVLKTSDGKYVYVHAVGTGPDANDVRIVMDFEAPNAGTFTWLNSGKYVGRRVLNATAKTMTMRVYDVSGVTIAADSANSVRIRKAAGIPNQPRDYRKAEPGEKQGDVLITETVTLSPSQSVGPSKRGNRNIIPITGGELTGRIPGKVLFGGADYQNLSGPPAIDAHYLWQAANGDIIIVRNTGSGSLVPTFEVRTDSTYAFLNTGKFLSSPPGMKPGGVGITMYESAR